jgi:hypothetical protein
MNTFYEELAEIEQIHIPQYVARIDKPINIQIHGIADASTKAYAVAMYLRVTDEYGNRAVRLIARITTEGDFFGQIRTVCGDLTSTLSR